MSTAGDHCCHNYSVIRADGRPRRRCLYRECRGCLQTYRGVAWIDRCCCDSITRALLDPWTTDSPHWTPRNGYTELPRLVPWDPDLLPDGNPPSGISGAMAQREGG
jgi:hypothetical protein